MSELPSIRLEDGVSSIELAKQTLLQFGLILSIGTLAGLLAQKSEFRT